MQNTFALRGTVVVYSENLVKAVLNTTPHNASVIDRPCQAHLKQ